MDEKEYQRLRNAYKDTRWPYTYDQAASDRLAVQLREFCLANGQDLEELNRFFQNVDQDIAIAFSGVGT